MVKRALIRASLLLNIFTIVVAVLLFFKFGGYVFWSNKIENFFSSESTTAPITQIRTENLKLVGETQKDIVFFGDSHTNYFEWGEYFNSAEIANRGIGSDTTSNMVDRVKQITELKPKKVFIMAGVNDIQNNIPIDETVQNISEIIKTVKKANPSVDIFLQSVLPLNVKLYENNYYRKGMPVNNRVYLLNEQLKKLGEEGVYYVDIANKLSVSNELNSIYTDEGLHLNKKGYEVWLNEIEKYVKK